ncbi:MAG: hypothetical protein NZ551_07765 [Microscillaceae bacterium]|nr:hypothetical protein [Microscillaceae bacterium]MDW8461092.1 hypothetical protein [Cytophagales bacterium]
MQIGEELSQEEFEFLLKSQQDLEKMKFLTQKGVAKVRIENLKVDYLLLLSKQPYDLLFLQFKLQRLYS